MRYKRILCRSGRSPQLATRVGVGTLLVVGFLLLLVAADRNAAVASDEPPELERKSILSGLVRGPGGAPLLGVKVRLIRYENAEFFYSKPVDEHGKYELRNLPEGRFAVHVVWAESGHVYPWPQPVILKKNEERLHNIWVKPVGR